MHLEMTEEQQMISQMAAKFAEQELLAHAAALDAHQGQDKFLLNLTKLADLGFMGLNIRSEYGGSEAGVVAFSAAITELAKGCAATAVTVSVTNMVAEVIQAVGTKDQCQYYLPKICQGHYSAGAFCLTESGAGSDPSAMTTRATQTPEGWILNGSKIYITSAQYAGVFVVWAVTDPSAPRGKGISCFLVEAGTPGVTIGKAEEKMGQRGSATNTVTFDNCFVATSQLLGIENQGFKIAVGELAGGRIGVASLALGIGVAAMDYAKSYISERKQFGQTIDQFQGIQWMMADRYTELEAARLLTMQAAWQKEQNQPFAASASMAKLFASEKANDACYTAIQLLGGAGYISEYPVERLARDARITTIYEGTSEIQRIIIARALMQDAL